jgi:hypothetical protein
VHYARRNANAHSVSGAPATNRKILLLENSKRTAPLRISPVARFTCGDGFSGNLIRPFEHAFAVGERKARKRVLQPCGCAGVHDVAVCASLELAGPMALVRSSRTRSSEWTRRARRGHSPSPSRSVAAGECDGKAARTANRPQSPPSLTFQASRCVSVWALRSAS